MASPVSVKQDLGIFNVYATPIQEAIDRKCEKARTVVGGKYTVLELDEDPKFLQQGNLSRVCFCFSREVEGSPYLISVAKRRPLDQLHVEAEKRAFERLKEVEGIAQPHVIEQIGDFQYVILDLFNQGALVDYVMENELEPWERDWIFYSVTKAVAKCHELNVVLRDIKIDHVVVRRLQDGKLDAKLIDLGPAIHLPTDTTEEARGIFTSAEFLPPEMFFYQYDKKPTPIASYKTDLWALGLVFYTMHLREVVLSDEEIALAMKGKEKPKFPEFNSIHLGPFTNEVRELLSLDPEKRPTANLILERISAQFKRIYAGFPIPYQMPG